MRLRFWAQSRKGANHGAQFLVFLIYLMTNHPQPYPARAWPESALTQEIYIVARIIYLLSGFF